MSSINLNPEQKKMLLEIARKTIENAVTGKNMPAYKIEDRILNTECGAFVTIHKNGNLRGCIGNVIGRGPLWKTVMQMAVEASLHDPRFSPLSESELEDIDIEISVLSPFEKIADIEKIEVGVHGIFIKKGYYQGLLLPQVATEYGWTRNQFLEHTCLKAGMHTDCYRDKGCEILIFSATVFGEKESGL
ncbi:MAG: AmmeMemoRadiSam system protein A [Actinobacteria bacterium]|nr:AmmeMemoRadiSam system protein A [Actinomycetota bacterium]